MKESWIQWENDYGGEKNSANSKKREEVVRRHVEGLISKAIIEREELIQKYEGEKTTD